MSHDRSPPVEENSSLFVDVLKDAPLAGHRQRRSIFGSVFYCVVLLAYAVVAVAAPWIFFFMPRMTSPLLCSCNVLLLLITGIFQQYWVHQVKKVRLQGYYLFSEKLKQIVRLPFATIAYGTALMLLAAVWQPFIGVLSVTTLLRIIMFIEVVCAGCFKSIYIGCIRQYNSLNGQPDVLSSLYSPLQPQSSIDELRYYDGGRLSDQQMALLQYQRENIHYLSEEILRLQECLSKHERTDAGSAPQVDILHLLATREQELRTLSAEMNQVHSELCLARTFIAERDSEIQRVRSINTQYVEENERLRAILAEWSARAAKLERALELERKEKDELRKMVVKPRSPLSAPLGVGE